MTQLNGVIAEAARARGFYYLADGDRDGRLRTALCDTHAAGVNFIALSSINGFVDQAVFPTNWIHNSLHPNELGHEAMARCSSAGSASTRASTSPASPGDISRWSGGGR